MSHEVFAFGSNMCSGRLRDYGVSPEGVGRPAVLGGHRLVFDKKSTKDNSGKANIEAGDSEVWGVLYSLSDADLSRLDDGETLLAYSLRLVRHSLGDGGCPESA